MVMRTFSRKMSGLVLSVFLGCSFSSALLSKDLTKAQKKELYRNGTITVYNDDGSKEGHFAAGFIPGQDNVSKEKSGMA